MSATARLPWNALFGVLHYVSSATDETLTRGSGSRRQRRAFLLLGVDALQVLPMVLHPVFGWNAATHDVVVFMDVVYIIQLGCTQLVPRLIFFALACALVIATLGLAILVCRRARQVREESPLVKSNILRGAGSVGGERAGSGSGEEHSQGCCTAITLFQLAKGLIVGALSTSMTKWLLMPVDCLVYDNAGESLSSKVHGAGSDCNPWQIPEVFIAVPALVLLAAYAVFASTMVYFGCDVNLLSRAPLAQFGCRLELLFLWVKILAVVFGYVALYTTPVFVSALLFLMSAFLLYRHLGLLPFQHHHTNLMRGGFFAALVWATFSTLVVSILSMTIAAGSLADQTTEWALISVLPVAFSLGVASTHVRRRRLQGEDAKRVLQKRHMILKRDLLTFLRSPAARRYRSSR